MNMCPTYLLKHTWNNEKQIISLIITNRAGLHYLAVKKFLLYWEKWQQDLMAILIVWIVYICLEKITNSNLI